MQNKKVYKTKLKQAILFTLFLIFAVNSLLHASDKSVNDNNYKYDREYLSGIKNEFIINNGDLIIKEFSIKGAKKTRHSYIMSQTKTRPGHTLSSFDSHQFVNRLKMKNIFSDIEIIYINDSGTAVIEIILTEKWTIIPLPMFSSNSRNTVYGLFILESNLLGYGKNLFTGGTWSNSGWSGMLGYIDPSFLNTDFRFNLFLIYKNSIYQNGDMDGRLLSEYKSVEKNARLDLGHGFKNRYYIYITGAYQSQSVDDNYKDSFNIPESHENFKSGLIFNINTLKYYEHFYYGFLMQSDFSEHIPAKGSSKNYTTSELRIDYSFKVFSFHKISANAFGFYGDIPEIAQRRIGGKPGFRTIPADIIISDKYASGTVSYEFPFLKYRWGAVTLLSFWEQGIFKNYKNTEPFYGPGAGLFFYLKRIAIPAVGFNYARNLKTGKNEFSVSGGYSM